MKISLHAMRIMAGYTVEEAAEHCGISAGEYMAYEEDSREIPLHAARKIRKLYGIPLDLLFAGTEKDYIAIMRKQAG